MSDVRVLSRVANLDVPMHFTAEFGEHFSEERHASDDSRSLAVQRCLARLITNHTTTIIKRWNVLCKREFRSTHVRMSPFHTHTLQP